MNFPGFKIIAVPDLHPIAAQVIGSNPAKVLIINNESELSIENRDFLARVLNAVQLDLASGVGLLTIEATDELALAPLVQHLQAQYVLCFGPSPTQLGIRAQIEAYTPTPLNNCKLLFAESLTIIRESREKGDNKRAAALWGAMRELFL